MKASQLFGAALALACSHVVVADDAKKLDASDLQALQELANPLPVETAKTTREFRERLRLEGKPVMTVRARPSYAYREGLDYTSRKGVSALAARGIPNQRPDIYGCVTVSFEILPDGKTDAFEIVKSEPAGVFDKVALRTVYATEFEPPAPAESGKRPRHEKAIWFLLAGKPPVHASMFNEMHEKERDAKRDALRAACEGPAP